MKERKKMFTHQAIRVATKMNLAPKWVSVAYAFGVYTPQMPTARHLASSALQLPIISYLPSFAVLSRRIDHVRKDL
jgi:hypothetical protein